MKITFRFILLFLIICANASADDSVWYSKNSDNKVLINVEMFLSSTCAHCQKADAFFQGITKQSSQLHLQRYFIDQDKNALIRFNQLLSGLQMNDFSVPSIFFCNSRWIGFASPETTGKDLLHAINYCKEQIEKNGKLTQTTVNTLRHWAYANQFNTGLVKKNPNNTYFAMTLAAIDAFNPCALFGFMGFLAVLFLEEQKKKQIIASLLFISSIVIIHYFQQVYTSSFFALLPRLRFPAVILGLLTLYFLVRQYKKQPNTILYFSLSFLLGLIIMTYQQTCVMIWSSVFEQWLNNQNLPLWQTSVYQLLYQSIYILPLILIFLIYLALFSVKRFPGLRKKLFYIGLLFMLAIALSLIAYPFILSQLAISVYLIFILIVCGYAFSKLKI